MWPKQQIPNTVIALALEQKDRALWPQFPQHLNRRLQNKLQLWYFIQRNCFSEYK